MPSFLSRLRERKLVQWAAAYLAGGWLLLEVTDFLTETFGWPIVVVRTMVALVGSGLLAVLIVAWYHGERGRQYVGSAELLLLALVLLLGAIGVAAATRGERVVAGGSSDAPAAHVREVTFTGNAWHAALSADGRFLAYSALADSLEHVVVQDIASGHADTIASITAASGIEWSPDGTRVLVSGFDHASLAGAVVIVSRDGGRARWLRVASTDRSNIPIAQWHPGGRHVEIRTSDFTRLLRVDVETEDTFRIAIPGEHDLFGGWSRDASGRRLAVAVSWNHPYRTELRIVDGAGRSLLLLRDTVQIPWVRWVGNRVYFSREQREIMRIDLADDGSPRDAAQRVLQLDALPSGWELVRYSITANGDRFTYTRGRRYTNVVRVDVASDGEVEMRHLTRGTARRTGLAVSPDGATVAYMERAAQQWEIFLVGSAGGNPRQLTDGARANPMADLAWSSDGRRIAFTSQRRNGTLWVADVSSGRIERAGGVDVATTGMIAWSPAPYILHVAPRMGGPTDSQLLRVAPETGVTDTIIEHGWIWNPEISPDGRRVAVLWLESPTASGTTGFRFIDLEDGSETTIPAFGYWPDGWSADGRYLLVSFYKPISAFYRVATEGAAEAQPERVFQVPVRVSGCKRVGATDRSFLCLAEDFVSDIALVDDFDAAAR